MQYPLHAFPGGIDAAAFGVYPLRVTASQHAIEYGSQRLGIVQGLGRAGFDDGFVDDQAALLITACAIVSVIDLHAFRRQGIGLIAFPEIVEPPIAQIKHPRAFIALDIG